MDDWASTQAFACLRETEIQNSDSIWPQLSKLEHMPGHTVCYPIVSACTNTVTLPTAHLGDYESFKTNLQTAIKYGGSFDRLLLVNSTLF
jgi:hypothetical protein